MKKVTLWMIFLLTSCTSFWDRGHRTEAASPEPAIVYLTWQHNPSATMTIQWITSAADSNDSVQYQSLEQEKWLSATGHHRPLPNTTKYLLHSIELTGLYANTEYLFKLGTEAAEYRFRTMPETLERPLCFVAGGDLYQDGISNVEKMNAQLAKASPTFALLGGDLAYSCGSRYRTESPDRWLTLLAAWTKYMVTPEGYLVPLIPAIGNHETMGGSEQTPSQAAYFYTLFPMPGPQGYNVLDFGDYMSVFILDSEHTHPVEGLQTQWLKKALEQRQQVSHKFAIYHEGAFPSVRAPRGATSLAILKNWVPLFELYGLDVAFENHDHAYKRTYPIRNEQIDPKGVIYVGDGSWGTPDPRKPTSSKKCWYCEKTLKAQQAVIVTVEQASRKFTVIDPQGKVLDEFIQGLR